MSVFLIKFLAFCAIIGFLNIIGIGPSSDNPEKMRKEAGIVKSILIYTYTGICFIGDVTIIGVIAWSLIKS